MRRAGGLDVTARAGGQKLQSLTPHRLYGGPQPSRLAHWAILAPAHLRDFLENPQRELFYGVESFGIVAQSIGRERDEA